MKKYKYVFIISVVVLILLICTGIHILDYASGIKDYRKILAVSSELEVAALKASTAGRSLKAADMQKIQADIDKLNEIELQEDTGISEEGINITDDKSPELSLQDANGPERVPGFITDKGNTVNIMFLGLDRSLIRDKTLGVYRTDAMSLASINLDTAKVEVLSIPRDSYVYIPEIGRKDKINHAYVWGGMGTDGIKCTIDTVNKFMKYSTVDYYFCMDMEPVPQIIDAIGGVRINVDADMKTHGYNLSKGFQLLDGEKAMSYIRWRYSGNGDIDRIKRQQEFVKEALKQMKERDKLLTDVKLILSYSNYIKTDMNIEQLVSLVFLLSDISNDSTDFHIIPGMGKTINNIWYWIPDEEKSDDLLKRFFKVGGCSSCEG